MTTTQLIIFLVAWLALSAWGIGFTIYMYRRRKRIRRKSTDAGVADARNRRIEELRAAERASLSDSPEDHQ